MMKVMLVRPPAPNNLSYYKIVDIEPLELEYLHTALKENGHDDYIYDSLVEQHRIHTVIRREKPAVVAITGYISQEKLMVRFAAAAKKINPDIKTIVGGVHAQINYERLYNPSIDFILRSESMSDFISLINHIESGSGALGDINGLCHKTADAYTVNELKPVCINDLPIPDRSFFYEHRKQFRYLGLAEVATVKTSFSCPYNCNFCYCKLLAGGRYQARDINLVIDELEGIDAQNIHIADDDFLIDEERVRLFLDSLKERKIYKTFICYSRADFIANHPALTAELADAGFRFFIIGLEAVTDNELSGYNKNVTADANRRCVEIINSTKADCIALMIAPIDATKTFFENIYNWVAENELTYVSVSVFTPIPGTELYEQYKDQITNHKSEHYDFLHLVMKPLNMSKRAFYFEYYMLISKLYQLSKDKGIYSFLDLEFVMNALNRYLRRKSGLDR